MLFQPVGALRLSGWGIAAKWLGHCDRVIGAFRPSGWGIATKWLGHCD